MKTRIALQTIIFSCSILYFGSNNYSIQILLRNPYKKHMTAMHKDTIFFFFVILSSQIAVHSYQKYKETLFLKRGLSPPVSDLQISTLLFLLICFQKPCMNDVAKNKLSRSFIKTHPLSYLMLFYTGKILKRRWFRYIIYNTSHRHEKNKKKLYLLSGASPQFSFSELLDQIIH